jgi:hypothetical protein
MPYARPRLSLPARALRRALPLALGLLPYTPAVSAQAAAPEASASAFGQRPRLNGERMLADLAALAHDSLEGRRTGTEGGARARAMVIRAFESRGVAPPEAGRTRSFSFSGRGGGEPQQGVNVLGLVPGTVYPDRYIVVTAHYDHLGIRNGQVYNGADDNASGSAAILALAAWFNEHRPRHCHFNAGR